MKQIPFRSDCFTEPQTCNLSNAGSYEYGGKTFDAVARALGGSYDECSTSALASLKLDAPCDVDKCSFNGVWHGGGGDGTHKLYIASYFFDRAQQV